MRAKVFGLNALKPYKLTLDEVQQSVSSDRVRLARQTYRDAPNPSYQTFGPKSRRQFLNLQQWGG